MWKQGYITIDGHTFRWEAKVYEQGSVFGIDNGRISKLWLAEYVGDPTSSMCKEAACYERGWEHRPDTPQAQAAVKQLIENTIKQKIPLRWPMKSTQGDFVCRRGCEM